MNKSKCQHLDMGRNYYLIKVQGTCVNCGEKLLPCQLCKDTGKRKRTMGDPPMPQALVDTYEGGFIDCCCQAGIALEKSKKLIKQIDQAKKNAANSKLVFGEER